MNGKCKYIEEREVELRTHSMKLILSKGLRDLKFIFNWN